MIGSRRSRTLTKRVQRTPPTPTQVACSRMAICYKLIATSPQSYHNLASTSSQSRDLASISPRSCLDPAALTLAPFRPRGSLYGDPEALRSWRITLTYGFLLGFGILCLSVRFSYACFMAAKVRRAPPISAAAAEGVPLHHATSEHTLLRYVASRHVASRSRHVHVTSRCITSPGAAAVPHASGRAARRQQRHPAHARNGQGSVGRMRCN